MKASAEGEGISLDERSVVASKQELAETVERIVVTYRQLALVEQFMPGREFTVGVIDGTPPRVLPVMEVLLGDHRLYSYEAKTKESVGEACPAELPSGEAARLGELAVRAGLTGGCRDYWRVDFRADAAGMPRVLEVNTLPWLEPSYSDIVKMAGPAGMTYDELIRENSIRGE